MTLTVTEPISVKDLQVELGKNIPGGILHAPGIQVAVNREIAHYDVILHDGDEVAFLPPFSGG